MPGNPPLENAYTPATAKKALTARATPLICRRKATETTPIRASAVMRMLSGAVRGKKRSQNDSLPPLGLGSYFMSVMKSWLPRKGPTQKAESRSVVTPTMAA